MNIEFIKWMCEKAEGFSCKFTGTIGREHVYYKYGSQRVPHLWSDIGNWMFYPLLLQRAIEGVNRSGYFEESQWEIREHKWGIEVLNYGGIPFSKSKIGYEKTSKAYLTDQAKEAALKWVWENEK